jgi:predicted nucleic acid-binding protein
MQQFIVDASVIVALFVKVPHSNVCIRFFELMNESLFVAPDALYFEVASSLRKLERRDLFDDVDNALSQVVDFPIVSVSCKDLMQAAAKISRDHLVSPYDAFYLALSQRDDTPLVTADERLANGTQGKGFDVRHVGRVVSFF